MHFRYERVALVSRAKHFVRSLGEVPVVDLLDHHYREYFVSRIDERNFAIEFQRNVVGDGQRDWYRKKMTIVQAHFCYDAIVVMPSHEPVERTESADCEQLEIADRALGETHGRQCFGVCQSFREDLLADH